MNSDILGAGIGHLERFEQSAFSLRKSKVSRDSLKPANTALCVVHKHRSSKVLGYLAKVLKRAAKMLGVRVMVETLPQEDLSVLEDGNAFLLTCWRVRRASNTV